MIGRFYSSFCWVRCCCCRCTAVYIINFINFTKTMTLWLVVSILCSVWFAVAAAGVPQFTLSILLIAPKQRHYDWSFLFFVLLGSLLLLSVGCRRTVVYIINSINCTKIKKQWLVVSFLRSVGFAVATVGGLSVLSVASLITPLTYIKRNQCKGKVQSAWSVCLD